MAKAKKPTKEMKYEGAPSGTVMLYNYKEPFIPVSTGFGYMGVLLFDAETDTVQCHLCGKWFRYLPAHVRYDHKTLVAEYKALVGLANTTALISESHREKLIASGLARRLQNLKNQTGVKRSAETRKKISDALIKRRSEHQNLTGTCPAQLTERLRRKYQELGRTPTQDEIQGYETFRRVFGNFEKACEVAGVPYQTPGVTRFEKFPYVEGEVILWIQKQKQTPLLANYCKETGKQPHTVSGQVVTHSGGWDALVAKALNGTTEEELLDFMRTFKKNHAREASRSDCKRGLLPPVKEYTHHFGSWQNALGMAYGTKK